MLAGKRVVIVEDEGLTQMQLNRLLTRAGVQVVGAANNAADGIEIVLQEMPDIVLMDINIQGEVNGLDAAAVLLRTVPLCIIMLTAYDEEQYTRKAREMGASGYIVKPVTSDGLLPVMKSSYEAWERMRPGGERRRLHTRPAEDV